MRFDDKHKSFFSFRLLHSKQKLFNASRASWTLRQDRHHIFVWCSHQMRDAVPVSNNTSGPINNFPCMQAKRIIIKVNPGTFLNGWCWKFKCGRKHCTCRLSARHNFPTLLVTTKEIVVLPLGTSIVDFLKGTRPNAPLTIKARHFLVSPKLRWVGSSAQIAFRSNKSRPSIVVRLRYNLRIIEPIK